MAKECGEDMRLYAKKGAQTWTTWHLESKGPYARDLWSNHCG